MTEEIETREATRWESERIVRTRVTDWICPYCFKANQREGNIGNFEACESCGKRAVLVRSRLAEGLKR